MESVQQITTFISNVGFPIACCFFLWKYVSTTMDEFKKTVEENTRMLTVLCERLGGGDRDD